ncbi:MAG: hypothetical protein KC708_24080 [Anaerolineae bacterium]|nr:hypothetical protein [Anaerolineae bacterium]
MRFRVFWLLTLVLGVVPFVHAQTCETIVVEALQTISDNCAETDRNQICYGNTQIDLLPQFTVTEPIEFETPGDKTDIEKVMTLTLYPLDVENEIWGISLLRVQANLPETLPGSNVTFLLFGDSALSNLSNEMDAVFFRSAIGSPTCEDAPDGILIQTPEGAGEVTFTLNRIEIQMGSTAYIQSEGREELIFNLLEGGATLTADDTQQVVEGGQFVTVPLGEAFSASGPPSDPQPIDFDSLPNLPLSLLPIDITDLLFGDGTDNSSDVDQLATSDEVIIPLSGSWLYTRGEVEVSTGCPPMMAEALTANTPVFEGNIVDFGGEPFDLETFMTENSQEPLPPGTFSQLDPNTFQWTMSEEGGSFIYQIGIISETQMNGFFGMDIAAEGVSCSITIPFEVQHEDN